MSDDIPISVRGLQKRYGDLEAVRGIDFEVRRGEVFGLLGPNGAGKTTTVEILEGLRERSGGEVSVLGLDPGLQAMEVKDRVGVSLQATNLPDQVTVREALEVFAALYSRSVDLDRLLERLQLSDKRNTYYAKLSGGQKQRLALALSLVNDPQVVFLDEPTSGLDPQVRLEIHRLMEELRADGRTLLLTTHYIEEAERLCDRVAIIDHGTIIAMGTPREIQQSTLGHSLVEVRTESPLAVAPEPAAVSADRVTMSQDRTALTAVCTAPARTVVELLRFIEQQGGELTDIQLKRPTLEDVFIELTGRRLRE